MKKLSILILLLTFQYSFGKSIDFIPVTEVSEWTEIINVCKKKNLPLLVHLTSIYGQEFKDQKKEFSDKELAKFCNKNYVPLEIYNNSNLGNNIQDLYGFDEEPRFIVFSNDEIILHSISGIKSSKELLTFSVKGLSSFQKYNDLILKYESESLTKYEWVEYLRIHLLNFGYIETIGESNRLMVQLVDDDLSDTIIWNYIIEFALDINHPVFKTIEKNSSIVDNPNKEFPWKEYYQNCYNLNLSFCISNKDSVRLSRMESELIPFHPDSNEHELQILRLNQQYLGSLNNWEQYKKITVEYLDSIANDSSYFYLEEAILVYDGFTGQEATELTLFLLDEGIAIRPTYKLHMTKSQVYYFEGKYDESLKEAELAYKYTDETNEKSNTQKFIEFLMYGFY